jgi:hypothetical protein
MRNKLTREKNSNVLIKLLYGMKALRNEESGNLFLYLGAMKTGYPCKNIIVYKNII